MSDATIPADDLERQLVVANPEDPNMPHIGLVGDTYTVLLSGNDTAGQYCVIDIYVPPGGGTSTSSRLQGNAFTRGG